MNISVGSTNKVKILAVQEMLREYSHLADGVVVSVDVPSGVSNQPKSLNETIRGAMNRAKAAYQNCNFSFGIESGLMQVPYAKSGYMDVCVCAIYDGMEFHLGLSSAWEFPDKHVMDMMLNEGLDMSQAINKAGLTNEPTIGSAEGAIGILTKGRLIRKEYTKQAILMALIHLDEHE